MAKKKIEKSEPATTTKKPAKKSAKKKVKASASTGTPRPRGRTPKYGKPLRDMTHRERYDVVKGEPLSKDEKEAIRLVRDGYSFARMAEEFGTTKQNWHIRYKRGMVKLGKYEFRPARPKLAALKPAGKAPTVANGGKAKPAVKSAKAKGKAVAPAPAPEADVASTAGAKRRKAA